MLANVRFYQLRLATTHNIPFLATSGRHGFNPTLGKLQSGLSIDLSKFDQLVVNAKAGTITVGPAIRYRDMLDPVYNAGFEVRKQAPPPLPPNLGNSIGCAF